MVLKVQSVINNSLTQIKKALKTMSWNAELQQLEDEEKEEQILEPRFRLITGGLIDTDYLHAIELPKFSLAPIEKNRQKTNERSPITLTFLGTKVCVQLCKAAKKSFKEFKIEFLDEDFEVESTWEFIEASIRVVDFGSITLEDSTPTIQCEIDFENLKIEGTII